MNIGSSLPVGVDALLAGRLHSSAVNGAGSIDPASILAKDIRQTATSNSASSATTNVDGKTGDGELREAFDSFVGEAFYGQLFQAMRKTIGKPAYFHGGRAEEAFQGQLDQLLAGEMSQKGAGGLSDSMYELFTLQRSR